MYLLGQEIFHNWDILISSVLGLLLKRLNALHITHYFFFFLN